MLIGLVCNVECRAILQKSGTAHGHSPPFAILDEVGQVRGPHDSFIEAIEHKTLIAVLQTQIMSDKLANDREMKDVKDALRSIASKLDNIEQALRER